LAELIKRFAFLIGAGPNPLQGEKSEENVPQHERRGDATAAEGGGTGNEVTGAAANARDVAAAASRHLGGEAK
jgi:hypothetical protein